MVGLCVAMAPGLYAKENKMPKILQKMAQESLGEDFRIVFEFVKVATICGGEGNVYIGQVEMNMPRSYWANTEEMDILKRKIVVQDNWIKLEKYYYIFASDLNDPKRSPHLRLSDPGYCME